MVMRVRVMVSTEPEEEEIWDRNSQTFLLNPLFQTSGLKAYSHQ
jgi:hypothetical protein